MTDTVYDIYFKGQISGEIAIDEVKRNFGVVFKSPAEKIDQLFSGKTCLLKKGLDKSEALKYQNLLKKAGAKIIIKAREAETGATPPTKPQTPAEASAATPAAAAAEQEQGGDMTLAPAGAKAVPSAHHLSIARQSVHSASGTRQAENRPVPAIIGPAGRAVATAPPP